MNKHWKFVIAALSLASTLAADDQPLAPNQMMQTPMDCSNMSPDMQTFAGKLSPGNKMTFCGKMTDGQRSMSMQMANQMDPTGKPTMTPDQAVEKIGQNLGASKGPSGCPVK